MEIESIKTERLTIRNITSDDLKSDKFINEFIDFFVDKESSPLAIYDDEFPTDHNEIINMAGRMAANKHHLAIFLSSTNTFIGYIFHIASGDGGKDLGIGYAIHSANQNKGYGTEALSSFIEYARKNTDFVNVCAGTANANKPSIRMLEKLNFKKMFEHTQSLRKDKQGKPIEYIESLYSYGLK